MCHTTKKPYQCKLYNKSFTYICRVRVFENNHAIFCAVFLLTYEVWSSVWIGPRSKILVHTTVCIMVTVRIMMYTVQCTVYITCRTGHANLKCRCNCRNYNPSYRCWLFIIWYYILVQYSIHVLKTPKYLPVKVNFDVFIVAINWFYKY